MRVPFPQRVFVGGSEKSALVERNSDLGVAIEICEPEVKSWPWLRKDRRRLEESRARPLEMLILDPGGELIVRNEIDDVDDDRRFTRTEEVETARSGGDGGLFNGDGPPPGLGRRVEPRRRGQALRRRASPTLIIRHFG